MSVICDVCGSTNRPTAKFCTGCANRLPGFAASGPSALEAMGALRPPAHVSAQERNGWLRNASSIPVLPAESPAFWFRLGMLLVAMTVVFMAWYLYVTREVTRTPGPGPIATVPAAAAPQQAAAPAKSAETALAPVSVPAPAAAPAAAQTSAPVAAAPPSAPPPPEVQPKAAEAAPAQARAAPPETRPAPRTRRYSREEPQPGEPSYDVVRRALTLAGAEKDPGPPIAPGPGPQYEWARTPSQPGADPGPPIVAGPGPLYDPSRATPRTPSWSANDPGPPIAIGPGPLVDYSAGGTGSR